MPSNNEREKLENRDDNSSSPSVGERTISRGLVNTNSEESLSEISIDQLKNKLFLAVKAGDRHTTHTILSQIIARLDEKDVYDSVEKDWILKRMISLFKLNQLFYSMQLFVDLLNSPLNQQPFSGDLYRYIDWFDETLREDVATFCAPLERRRRRQRRVLRSKDITLVRVIEYQREFFKEVPPRVGVTLERSLMQDVNRIFYDRIHDILLENNVEKSDRSHNVVPLLDKLYFSARSTILNDYHINARHTAVEDVLYYLHLEVNFFIQKQRLKRLNVMQLRTMEYDFILIPLLNYFHYSISQEIDSIYMDYKKSFNDYFNLARSENYQDRFLAVKYKQDSLLYRAINECNVGGLLSLLLPFSQHKDYLKENVSLHFFDNAHEFTQHNSDELSLVRRDFSYHREMMNIAFLLAARLGKLFLTKHLIHYFHADINAMDRYGNNAVILAVKSGNVDLVCWLRDHTTIRLNHPNHQGEHALLVAKKQKDICMVSNLLSLYHNNDVRNGVYQRQKNKRGQSFNTVARSYLVSGPLLHHGSHHDLAIWTIAQNALRDKKARKAMCFNRLYTNNQKSYLRGDHGKHKALVELRMALFIILLKRDRADLIQRYNLVFRGRFYQYLHLARAPHLISLYLVNYLPKMDDVLKRIVKDVYSHSHFNSSQNNAISIRLVLLDPSIKQLENVNRLLETLHQVFNRKVNLKLVTKEKSIDHVLSCFRHIKHPTDCELEFETLSLDAIDELIYRERYQDEKFNLSAVRINKMSFREKIIVLQRIYQGEGVQRNNLDADLIMGDFPTTQELKQTKKDFKKFKSIKAFIQYATMHSDESSEQSLQQGDVDWALNLAASQFIVRRDKKVYCMLLYNNDLCCVDLKSQSTEMEKFLSERLELKALSRKGEVKNGVAIAATSTVVGTAVWFSGIGLLYSSGVGAIFATILTAGYLVVRTRFKKRERSREQLARLQSKRVNRKQAKIIASQERIRELESQYTGQKREITVLLDEVGKRRAEQNQLIREKSELRTELTRLKALEMTAQEPEEDENTETSSRMKALQERANSLLRP